MIIHYKVEGKNKEQLEQHAEAIALAFFGEGPGLRFTIGDAIAQEYVRTNDSSVLIVAMWEAECYATIGEGPNVRPMTADEWRRFGGTE